MKIRTLVPMHVILLISSSKIVLIYNEKILKVPAYINFCFDETMLIMNDVVFIRSTLFYIGSNVVIFGTTLLLENKLLPDYAFIHVEIVRLAHMY